MRPFLTLPRLVATSLVTVLIALFAGPVTHTVLRAQGPVQMADFTGDWVSLIHEDQIDRIPGASLGDYTGLPINAAARQKALTWDATVLSEPERQAQPHPAQYSSRGPGPNLRITRVLEPVTENVIAYELAGYYGRADRTIWMDGRPHPDPVFGEHTWSGFSTGKWDKGQLVVTTTHMKMGVIQRNGVPSSPYARMTEYYVRHGDFLTMVSIVDDPIYLDEPMVRSQSWRLSVDQVITASPPFEPVEEFVDKPRGYVPTNPLGTVQDDFSRQYGIPLEAAMGGRETAYPEFQQKLKTLAPPPAKPAARKEAR